MKRYLLVLLMVAATTGRAQDYFFTLDKDMTVVLQENVQLVSWLTEHLQALESYDGKKVVFIPTQVELKKGKTLFSKNHVCQYNYNPLTTAVSFKALKTSGTEFDFEKKKVQEKKNQPNNEADHYKPANREAKIKDQEKKKPKGKN